jgi:biotin carboxyl carrier protein
MALKTFDVNGKTYSLELVATAQGFDVTCDGQTLAITHVSIDQSMVLFEIDGRQYCVDINAVDAHTKNVLLVRGGAAIAVHEKGQEPSVAETRYTSIQPAHLMRTVQSNQLKSPLAGRITRVLVQQGQSVTAGQTLLFIESMKMENEICAQGAAFIKTIFISEGFVVQPDQILIEFEKEGESNATSKNEHEQKAI